MEASEEVLFSEGYDSPSALIRDWALIVSLSRVEQYRSECDFFQNKYGMTMEDFESHLNEERGHEDFEKEDDMAACQFSLEALKWWEEKVKNLQK